MIITDESRLRVKCAETTLAQCEEMNLFGVLEQELKGSQIEGIGLAAPQIGISLRACIIRIPAGKNRQATHLNMINPIVEKGENPGRVQGERCLSIPGVTVDTLRYGEVMVSWLDSDTKEYRRALFYGLESFVVQHECDHLDGILMVDRAPRHGEHRKVGRNDPCFCGSGKKFKKCCIDKEV